MDLVQPTFTSVPVACPKTGFVADAIEVLSNTGNTVVRYDSVGGHFIKNWQTPRSPGACYSVTMTTADGSFISANFILK